MMRILVPVAALILPGNATAAEPSEADKIALHQLAGQMDQAWTVADVDANAALFTVDATARFADDPPGEGREAIRAQFQSFFKDRPSGLRHVTALERVEQLTPNLALWEAEVRVERQQAGGHWSPVNRIRNVSVVAREADQWRIKAVRAFPEQSTASEPAAQATTTPPSMAPTHAMLVSLAHDLDHAWNDGDAQRVTGLYTEDVTIRFGDGQLDEGREAIKSHLSDFFRSRPVGLRHATIIDGVKLISDDLAIWDGQIVIERRGSDGQWSPARRSRNVVLAAKGANGWRIRTIRSFPVRSGGSTAR